MAYDHHNLAEPTWPTAEEVKDAFFYLWLSIRMVTALTFRMIAMPSGLGPVDEKLDYEAKVLVNAFVLGWTVDLILWNLARKETFTPFVMVTSQFLLFFACVWAF